MQLEMFSLQVKISVHNMHHCFFIRFSKKMLWCESLAVEGQYGMCRDI